MYWHSNCHNATVRAPACRDDTTPRTCYVGAMSSRRASAESSKVDGRMLRSERSRGQIVEAMIALLRDGRQPTAELIAERAGVGARTVFRHFEDKDALAAAVAARVEREIAPRLDLSPIEGSLPRRVRELVRRRAGLYERLAPFRRAALPERERSRTVGRLRASLDRVNRQQLEATFGPEMQRLGADLVEAVDALASFETWDRLRADQRLSRARAAAAMERGLLALLGARG